VRVSGSLKNGGSGMGVKHNTAKKDMPPKEVDTDL
jgi:hypothetical protein